MSTSETRVLAELIAQYEDEWESLPPIRPGRAYYVASCLIEAGIAYARST